MIPIIGVPVLSRADLLYRMIGSIDHRVGRLVIVDNGDVVSRYEVERIWQGARIIKPGFNLGVAASWNLIMKANALAPWWLLANDDLMFAPGDLQRLAKEVDPDAAVIYHLHSFAAFAVTQATLYELGWFDENFHPAYDEDVDYARRAELAGVPRLAIMSGSSHTGSATIMGDRIYRTQNRKTHGKNDEYYMRKWGGPKMGGERFTTPFDRGGSVRDWTLESDRLRDQAWSLRAIRAVR